MYLQGHEANVWWFKEALETFCEAYKAQINWHKSYFLDWARGSSPVDAKPLVFVGPS